MKKKNYLIPTLSLLFLGVAAFFIVKGINAKKAKKDESKPTPPKKVGSIIVDDPIKVEPFPSESDATDIPNDVTKKKVASSELISKAGTRLREKPSTSSTIVKSLASGLKLKRVPNSPLNFLANLPVKDGDNYWLYVQIENALTKGYVRTDAVNI